MPRKNGLPESERAICRRLREFREASGLSQVEFARRAGLDGGSYASYEYERAKLNYPVAYKILTTYVMLGPKWLALGGSSAGVFFGTLPKPGENMDGPKTPFSEVYQSTICHRVAASRAAAMKPAEPFPIFRPDGSPESRVRALRLFVEMLKQYLQQLQPGEVDPFMNELDSAMAKAFQTKKLSSTEDADLIAARMLEIDAFGHGRIASDENSALAGLLTIAEYGNCFPMTLPQLLNELKTLTEVFGKKAELAEFLNATPSSLSHWLSGNRQPGGEVTLRMLEWVQAEKAKQKALPVR
jgi:transcriptional regulator with XRE-family HTH domain